MNTCSTVQKCNIFFQQYAMHQCSNKLSPLPPIILREPTNNLYNALYHLISEHSNNGTIPGEPLVKMFIHKAGEEALGINQNATEKYRRDNQIPDSDGFAMIMPRDKRGRSETMSTNLSDKHDTNRPRYAGIPGCIGVIIYIFSTTIIWKESMQFVDFEQACGTKYAREHSHISHGALGGLISPICPTHAPWFPLNHHAPSPSPCCPSPSFSPPQTQIFHWQHVCGSYG